MSEQRRLLSRRHFLFTLGAGGAATAATVTANLNATKQAPDAAPERQGARGYRESAHIARYYRSTRI